MTKKDLLCLLEKYTGYRISFSRVSNGNSVIDYEKLKNIKLGDREVKLHFGCGPRVLKDWINIDILYEPYENYLKYYGNEFYPAEIRGNREDFYEFNAINLGIPLPNDSVDLIFHEDFIEHLNQRDQIVFLTESFRVMKKGAIHRINTPNLISSMTNYSKFFEGLKGVYVSEWDKYGHFLVLTKNYLKEIAELIGYSQVIFNEKNNSTSKKIPREYRPGPDRGFPEANIFCDLVK